MDQGSLVENQIKDGARIVEALRASGFDVVAAWWMKETEEGLWFLYVASKEVDEKGIKAAYHAIHIVMRDLGELWVDRFKVKMVGPENLITKDVLNILAHSSGRLPPRFGGRKLGNVTIDGSYIYPPAVAV